MVSGVGKLRRGIEGAPAKGPPAYEPPARLARPGAASQLCSRMVGRMVLPGMAHCGGGPATDSFDMLPQFVDWVEKGVAPDAF